MQKKSSFFGLIGFWWFALLKMHVQLWNVHFDIPLDSVEFMLLGDCRWIDLGNGNDFS